MNPLYNNITVGIKTFNRHETLVKTLDSLIGHPFKNVIIADDGTREGHKDEIYQHYSSKLPLEVLYLPNDTGLSAGRNAVVNHCRTKYLLMLDDDEGVPDNIIDLALIMEHDSDLGGISGYWDEYGITKCDARNLFLKGNFVIKDIQEPAKPTLFEQLTYFIYDYIPNSTLFRTECLLEVPWDNFYKIGSEHIDFYLTHKHLGKWRFAVTPDVVISHFPKLSPKSYINNYRHKEGRLKVSYEYFCKKWNVRGVILGKRHIPHENQLGRNREQISHRLMSIGVPSSIVFELQNKQKYIYPITRVFIA